MDQSHAEHIIMLNKTHDERMQLVLDVTESIHTNYVEILKTNHAVELWGLRNQLDRAQKRNVELEGDIKTIAGNKAKCDKFKKETDAILEGY